MSDTSTVAPDRDDLELDLAGEPPPAELRFELGSESDGQRIDVVLSDLAEIPRAQVRRWIKADRVQLNGKQIRPSRKASVGDVLVAQPPALASPDALPEDIPIHILYQDNDLIVIDKAPGMVVHPAPGHSSGTLVNALLHHCKDLAGVGGTARPGIVHRLDRGTSGVMVVAKNDDAHRALSLQFHDHTIGRVYRAFVRSLPGADDGAIDEPIGRHPRDRKRMTVRPESGRKAKSNWKVLIRYRASGISLLEIRPESGRTHQIRVHLSSRGMPIVGDEVYGRARNRARSGARWIDLDRAALHAASLGFTHPTSRDWVEFEAPFPPDLESFRSQLVAREAT